MVFDLSKVTGIGEYTSRTESSSKATTSGNAVNSSEDATTNAANPAIGAASRILYFKTVANDSSAEPSAHPPVFLVDNGTTIEVRSDEKLIALLTEQYESVMKSRYFGSGGLEIVLAGHQLSDSDLADLVRLSYNLTH